MRVEGNEAHNLHPLSLGEVGADQVDELSESVDLELEHPFHSLGVSVLDVHKRLLHLLGEEHKAGGQDDLIGLLLHPNFRRRRRERLDRLDEDITEGDDDVVDDSLQVVLHPPFDLERLAQVDVLHAHAGVEAGSAGPLRAGDAALEVESLDRRDDLAHVEVDLGGIVAVAEDVEQVRGGHEVEAREDPPLLLQVVGKRLLAHLQLRLGGLQLREQALGGAGTNSVLGRVHVLQHLLDVHVDARESLRVLG
mmetsp:Transcript_3208/g.7730  ORF Transcript_3208/g.7730 Transcript_3208/m.7730 type:complete len:251 (-) Transcript_3208:1901-2653(-)